MRFAVTARTWTKTGSTTRKEAVRTALSLGEGDDYYVEPGYEELEDRLTRELDEYGFYLETAAA